MIKISFKNTNLDLKRDNRQILSQYRRSLGTGTQLDRELCTIASQASAASSTCLCMHHQVLRHIEAIRNLSESSQAKLIHSCDAQCILTQFEKRAHELCAA